MNRNLISRIPILLTIFICITADVYAHDIPELYGSVLSLQGSTTKPKQDSEDFTSSGMRGSFNLFATILNIGLDIQRIDNSGKYPSGNNPLHATLGLGAFHFLMLQYVTTGHFRTAINIFPLATPWNNSKTRFGFIERFGLGIAYDYPISDAEGHRISFGVSFCFCTFPKPIDPK